MDEQNATPEQAQIAQEQAVLNTDSNPQTVVEAATDEQPDAGDFAEGSAGGNGGDNSSSSWRGTGGAAGDNPGTNGSNGGGGGGAGGSANNNAAKTGGNGGAGTEWDGSHGSGGGGGGGGAGAVSAAPGNGGLYGGGGAGSGLDAAAGQMSHQGIQLVQTPAILAGEQSDTHPAASAGAAVEEPSQWLTPQRIAAVTERIKGLSVDVHHSDALAKLGAWFSDQEDHIKQALDEVVHFRF